MKKILLTILFLFSCMTPCFPAGLERTQWLIKNSGGYSYFFYGDSVFLVDADQNMQHLESINYSGMYFYGSSCYNLRKVCFSIYGKCLFTGIGIAITCVKQEGCMVNTLIQIQ